MTGDSMLPGVGIVDLSAASRLVLLEEALEFTAEQWARIPAEQAKAAYWAFTEMWSALVRNGAPQKWRDEVLAARSLAAVAAWPDAAQHPPF